MILPTATIAHAEFVGGSTPVPHVFEIRAPQGGSGTTSSNTVSVNTSPFFPDPSTVIPPPVAPQQQNQNQNSTGNLAKSILEYLFLAIAILIVASMIVRRFIKLRKANKPLSTFFSSDPDRSRTPYTPRTFPRTTGLPPISSNGSPLYPFYHSSYLSNVPAVYVGPNRERRVHALDTDTDGRRMDSRGERQHDHDGVLEDKDVLPAYDNVGGPPKYDESEILTRILAVRAGAYRRMEEGRHNGVAPRDAPAYPQVAEQTEGSPALRESSDTVPPPRRDNGSS